MDELTPHLALPLPHPDNELDQDIFRLRDALKQIDAAVQTLRLLVSSDDVNMDTVQEIVSVIKDAQGDIGNITAILSTKASKGELAAATAAGFKAAQDYVDSKAAPQNEQIDKVSTLVYAALLG